MDQIKRLIRKGVLQLDRDIQNFEKEYHSTSDKIDQVRKEMEEWRQKRKIIRSK
ncbi:hypothetical protein GNP94_22115 [Paenibacillus campinasensis]|uniref:FbpB family small basic protein n=1 Tax=Paenibacillus campinasensis TaxID=66347 RepID=A0ABW9T5S1_9BACL|nr:hypothetical protein [Paenibacillus campinasensis]MUG68670.1 hypothetical protein [Paenibacillus campinasensis]